MDKATIIALIEHRVKVLELAGFADPIEEFKEIYKLMLELAKVEEPRG